MTFLASRPLARRAAPASPATIAAIAAVAMVAGVTGGCASARPAAAEPTPADSSPAAPSAASAAMGMAPTITGRCGPPSSPARVMTVRAADGTRLEAGETGNGRRGVLLVPELGQLGMCGWWTFALRLGRSGYRVLIFNHRCTGQSSCPSGPAQTDLMADIRGAVSRLRHDGASTIALVGA